MARRRFRHAAATVAAASVLLTSVFATSAKAATVTDGFEPGSGTVLTGSGATLDCGIRHAGNCSLKINPVGSGEAHFSHARSTVNLPIQGPTTVSFQFWGDTTWGDVDSNVIVYFDTGQWVLLHTTEGFNNQVSLLSQIVPNRIVFGSWNAQQWHQMKLVFDAAADTVTATAPGGSATLAIPPTASAIARVEFWGYRWSSSGTPLRYDSLNVTNTTPVVVNTAPRTTLDSPANGGVLPFGGPHEFKVRATDDQGDTYRPTVTIRNAAGAPVRTMTPPGLTSNQQQTTLKAEPRLEPGQYTWSATSVDSKGAQGAVSETRSFTVDDGRYVALGDSFSSGEGVSPFEAGTDVDGGNICHRSELAYARLIEGAPGVPSGAADFHACSGAKIEELFTASAEPRFTGEPRQFDHLDEHVSLVTMSISGNDAGFAKVLEHCFFNVNCHEEGIEVEGAAAWGGDEVPTDEFVRVRIERLATGKKPDPGYNATDRAIVEKIRPLSEVYRQLQEEAGNATVVIVGYPKFFSLEEKFGCNRMNHDEQVWMNEQVEALNLAIRTNLLPGWKYADVEDAFEGHHLCEDGADDWMWGVALSDGEMIPDARFRFHPKAQGQQAFADAVLAALGTAPANRTTHTVAPQQTVSRKFTVPFFAPKFMTALRWPGSDIELSLRSPSGRHITRATVADDVTRDTGATYDMVGVTNPEPGEWTLEMYGADVPPDGEEATLDVTVTEPVNLEPTAQATASVTRNTVTVDGSASFDPDGSIVKYEWFFEDGTVLTGPTTSYTYAQPGTYRVTLMVHDDRGAVGFHRLWIDIVPYEFTGFAAPINAEPTLNSVNAGRTIPVKWRVLDAGAPVADPASFVSVTSAQVPCDTSAPVDVLEEVAVSNAGLRYSGEGWWSYTWSTNAAWAGTCRRMTLRLADGAPGRTAVFDFR